MSFETWIVAFCDRFVSQRSFELIVAPAPRTAPRCCRPSLAA